MRFYKRVDNGYIVMIGTGAGGAEITESEYGEIMSVIQNKPVRDGFGYRLREDLTWEEYPADSPEPSEEINSDEIAEALEEIL